MLFREGSHFQQQNLQADKEIISNIDIPAVDDDDTSSHEIPGIDKEQQRDALRQNCFKNWNQAVIRETGSAALFQMI